MIIIWIASTCCLCIFFFNDTATTEIYTLSLHDALPISCGGARPATDRARGTPHRVEVAGGRRVTYFRAVDPFPLESDRKSTRLNSSHGYISYAVFCLKKKKVFKRLHIAYHDSGYF